MHEAVDSHVAHRLTAIAAGLLLFACGGSPPPGNPPSGTPLLRLNATADDRHFGTVEAVNLDPDLLADLAGRGLSAEEWKAIFAVYTGPEPPAAGDGKPPVAGTYGVADGLIRFRPRHPLVTGLTYSAVLDLGDGTTPSVVASFALPKEEAAATTVVSQVYPSADELPANLLRLYVHFSAPMSRGEAYEHVRLLGAAGDEMAAPFVEIGEELWDPAMRRLTLFFDPGRIKRGLRPHLEAGPPLAEGGSYRLAIDAGWPDARGLPLKEGFEKRFTVVAADRASPDPADWRLTAPAAGSREPVELTFPEPLDHGLLERVLYLRDGRGRLVEGGVEVSGGERRWAFTPAAAWQAGEYRIEVETLLEDVAGNNLRKVFDVDLSESSGDATQEDRVFLPFSVVASRSASSGMPG